MAKKECFKCGLAKPLTEFYRHPGMKDGRVNKCKECNKKDVRENRSANIEYYREYDRSRADQSNRVAARNAYQKTQSGKRSAVAAKRRYIQKHPVRRAAHVILGNAVRDGKIIKPERCETCGRKARLHGHHEDYGYPLSVHWLCPKCHSALHKKLSKEQSIPF